jgi:hypothetical protein
MADDEGGVSAESPHEALVEPWYRPQTRLSSVGGGSGQDGGGSGSGLAADDAHEQLVEPWWRAQNRLYNAARQRATDDDDSWALTPVGRPHEGVRTGDDANGADGQSPPPPGSQDVPFEQNPTPWWPAPYPNKPVYEDIAACGMAPVNTRIEVLWPGAPGSSERDHWYAGKVVAIKSFADGQLRHTLRYEGWAEEFPGHDLAHGPKWRYPDPWWLSMQPRPDAQARPQAAAPHEQPDDQKASRPRRALRTRKAKEPVG